MPKYHERRGIKPALRGRKLQFIPHRTPPHTPPPLQRRLGQNVCGEVEFLFCGVRIALWGGTGRNFDLVQNKCILFLGRRRRVGHEIEEQKNKVLSFEKSTILWKI